MFGHLGIALFVATVVGGCFVLHRMERWLLRNAELEQRGGDGTHGRKPDEAG